MFETISQSNEYAAEYNKKKEALLKAKEDTQFHFNKKKSATVERKQVSQERAEVKSRKNKNKIRLYTQLQWPVHSSPQSHHTPAVIFPATFITTHRKTVWLRADRL